MPKTIIIFQDDFYADLELQTAGGGLEKPYVQVTVDDTWYANNSGSLATHYLAENDGADVRIIECDL